MRKGQELRARRYFVRLLIQLAVVAGVLGMLYISLPPDELEGYLTDEAKAKLLEKYPPDNSFRDDDHEYFKRLIAQRNAKWEYSNYFIVKYAHSSNLGVTFQAYPLMFWSFKE